MSNRIKVNALRTLAALLVPLTLAACVSPSATGGPFAMPRDEPKDGNSRLVLYRVRHFTGHGADVDILLDGTKICDMPEYSALVRDVRPGKHKLAVDVSWGPGTSVITVDLQPGETKYIRTGPNPSRIGKAFIPVYGLFAAFIDANTETTRGGDFGLDAPSTAAAVREMQGSERALCGGA